MCGEGTAAVVQSGRDAAARGDWQAAFDLLMQADTDGFAGPAELPLLGEVAYAARHFDARAYLVAVPALYWGVQRLLRAVLTHHAISQAARPVGTLAP